MNPLAYVDPVVGLMVGFLTLLAMGFAAYGAVLLMRHFARCDACGRRKCPFGFDECCFRRSPYGRHGEGDC